VIEQFAEKKKGKAIFIARTPQSSDKIVKLQLCGASPGEAMHRARWDIHGNSPSHHE